MNNIKIHDKTISDIFSSGEIAFRIIVYSRRPPKIKEKGMVTTFEEYKEKLFTHQYTPLLFIIGLPQRLAYLYGCLNYSFDQHHESEYVFIWRKLGERIWRLWFTVYPYEDSVE